MVYCTIQDISDAVRWDALLSWCKDDSRENDALAYSRVEQAIARATDEINLYIGKVVTLPLANVPTTITDCCVKIAIYKAASRKGIMKDSADMTIRTNYEDAIKLLKLIAEGKVSLGIDSNNEAIPTATESITSFFPPSRMNGHRGGRW